MPGSELKLMALYRLDYRADAVLEQTRVRNLYVLGDVTYSPWKRSVEPYLIAGSRVFFDTARASAAPSRGLMTPKFSACQAFVYYWRSKPPCGFTTWRS